MTLQDHHKLLGIFHLLHGCCYALGVFGMSLVSLLSVYTLSNHFNRLNEPPLTFFTTSVAVIVALYASLAIPSIIAGYALLKRRRWARGSGIVSGVLALPNFPLGTLLGAYSLWFFFGSGNKDFYKSLTSNACRLDYTLTLPPLQFKRRRVAGRIERAYAPPPSNRVDKRSRKN